MLALVLLAIAVPAHAERLTFDHRLYPPLKAVLDSGDAAMIDYNPSNPRYVVDLIAIKGKSAADWREAIEIIARTPSKDVGTARAWHDEMILRANRLCPNTVTDIAEDSRSITFQRQSPDCPAERAETAITQIVASKRSLFAITFLFKGVPDAATRQQALDLLASAHIE